jgi:hypothetical protein
LGATCSANTRRSVSAAVWLVIAARNSARNVSSSQTAKNRGSKTSAISLESIPANSGNSITKWAAAANNPCLEPKYRITSAASTPTSAATARKVVRS